MRCHSLCGTSPRKTSVSVPLLMALVRACINSSPGAAECSGCALISPRPGAATQNARASSIGGIIRVVAESDPRALVDWVANGHDRQIHPTFADVDPDHPAAAVFACTDAGGARGARALARPCRRGYVA